MKRIYILEGLDCANCAEEIRAEVEKDERVKSAEMNFMKQELTVEAENSSLRRSHNPTFQLPLLLLPHTVRSQGRLLYISFL